MQKNLSILGTGLICLDIIHNNGNKMISNGGSCANVLSILSQLGWRSLALKPKYDDPWDDFIESNFSALGVSVVHDKFVRKNCPRVIEELNNQKHKFQTVCPDCNKKLLTLPSVSTNLIKNLQTNFDNIDVFYHDRVSSGIREIVSNMHQKGTLVFYEPNSARNPSLLEQDALNAEIVKFSKNKISMQMAEKLRTKAQLGKTKVIIITDGDKGLHFSYLTSKNLMSKWERIAPFESDDIIDTSGAGDWMSAGFIDHFMSSWDISKGYVNKKIVVNSIIYGREYAKLCCKSVGAQGVFYSLESMTQLNKKGNDGTGSSSIRILPKVKYIAQEKVCRNCLLPIS